MLLFLTCCLAVPVPERGVEKTPSIACKLENSYIGNVIDFQHTLEIRDKDWSFVVLDRSVGLPVPRKTTTAGSYEIRGDLAFFTVDAGGEGKFGINFRRIKGVMYFDRFFPGDDGRLSYARQWFTQRDGKWVPLELRRLFFVAPNLKAVGHTLDLHFEGERTLWNDKGEPSTTRIDAKVAYKALEGTNRFAVAGKLPSFLPGDLSFSVDDGRITMAGPADHIRGMHGFGADLWREKP
jgi:hypothetical protein